VVTRSEEETVRLGRLIASHLPPGSFLLLSGELGCGKTVLVRGVAEALGIPPDEISSPSFNIVHEYDNLVHVDLYRLEALEQLEDLGFEDFLTDERIKVVEWGKPLKEIVENFVEVECRDRGGEREFTICDPKGKICRLLKTEFGGTDVENS